MKKKYFFILIIFFLILSYYLTSSSYKLTDNDIKEINFILKDINITKSTSKPSSGIDLIKKINLHLFKLSSTIDKSSYFGIPINESRSFSKWIKFTSPWCFDISRAAEEIYHYLGFNVRHVSVYHNKFDNLFISLFSYVNSHALLEVETDKGWMAVDPHMGIAFIDTFGNPVQTTDIIKSNLNYNKTSKMHSIFLKKHIVIYGLFSRHGGYYEPFVPFPDIIWSQFLTLSNFTSVNEKFKR